MRTGRSKAYIDRGELVPDVLTVQMVLDRISQPDCANGVLLDGFPRTIAQAQSLDKGLQGVGKQIDLAAKALDRIKRRKDMDVKPEA